MTAADIFAWPDGWPVLLAVPAVWIFVRARDRRRARRLDAGVGPRAAELAADTSRRQRRARRWLWGMGLLLASVAVLQPMGGAVSSELEQRGVDILVCLDVSRSMLARDLAPDRLSRARDEIRALIRRARGDRLGLVAFAGDATLVAPLTQDVDSLDHLLEQVDPLSVTRGGTDLGAALELALEALADASGEHEVMLLLTDGEDLGERGLRVAETCRDRNITVHTVGFGSARGSKIAIEGDGGESYLLDHEGREVVTALDPLGLRRIAEVTGGRYVNAASRPLPLVALHERSILPMARKAFEARSRRARANCFQWPLLVAVLLWIVELALTDRRRRP